MAERENNKGWPTVDRRSLPRVTADIAGHAVTEEQEPIVVRARNISCAGVYCHINRYIPPFQKLRLAMIIPLSDGDTIHSEMIRVEGVTVRVEPEEPEDDVVDYHIAIFFENVSEKDQKIIEKYVDQQRRRNQN